MVRRYVETSKKKNMMLLLYDVDDGYSLLVMHIMLPGDKIEIRRSGYTISGCIRFCYTIVSVKSQS